MNSHTRRHVVVSCLMAVGAGVLGFAVARSNAADDAKHHQHAASMQEHMQMMKGAEGASMMKEHMLKMAAHQAPLGEMATNPELKKMAQDPQMMKAMQDVKAALKDHKTFDAKKAEVAKDHREAMMVMAHALMKQDKELDQAMKAAEEGKHHGAGHQ